MGPAGSASDSRRSAPGPGAVRNRINRRTARKGAQTPPPGTDRPLCRLVSALSDDGAAGLLPKRGRRVHQQPVRPRPLRHRTSNGPGADATLRQRLDPLAARLLTPGHTSRTTAPRRRKITDAAYRPPSSSQRRGRRRSPKSRRDPSVCPYGPAPRPDRPP